MSFIKEKEKKKKKGVYMNPSLVLSYYNDARLKPRYFIYFVYLGSTSAYDAYICEKTRASR